jgi:hypothetical protein
MADDDLWHVRLAPDEVKQLTLEQLDDLFRLEVIEASTLIWQPGMTEWLPLSVVAGLGEEEPEAVSIAVSEAPPAATHRMAQTATTWPPRAEPAASWPPQARSAPPRSLPPPPSARSATPPPRSAPPPPRPPAPVAASLPPSWSSPPPRPAPVSAHASTVPLAQPARSAPPPSVAPPRYVDPFASPPTSIAPMAAPSFGHTQVYQQSGGGGWIVALAFAAGVAVTLYRNDIVHAAARNIGQESSYLKLEQALGGPSFGTPRAVATMAAAAAAITVSPPAPPSPPVTAPSVTSTADTPSAPAATSTATSTGPTTPATAAQPAEPARTTKSAPAAAPRSAPAHRPASNSQASEPVDSVFKTPKKGKKAGKGSEYDPLNPSL